jgi:pyroglutamyl-peptidase
MHALHGKPRMRGGFIHIPYAPEQAARHPGAPSLPVDVVTAALRIGLRIALATTVDRHVAAGAEH